MATESKSKPTPRQATRRNGRVHRGKITDRKEAHAAIDRATSMIKTKARIDFVRSVRGR